MHRLLKYSAIILLLTMCATSTSAQYGASITGSVIDQNKDAITGAAVKLINIASGLIITAKTGPSGEYRINDLLPGSYRISVDRDGFATAARTVTLAGAEQMLQNFSLAPGTIRDAITVTAGKGNARA